MEDHRRVQRREDGGEKRRKEKEWKRIRNTEKRRIERVGERGRRVEDGRGN